MSFSVVIPARLESSRLPGKVLADICGHPMIYHTYQQGLKSGAKQIIIATDSHDVRQVAEKFGAKVCMTAKNHLAGTDRINEACQTLGFDDDEIVVNLQADEPMINPALIDETANILQQDLHADVATLGFQITSKDEVFDPNVVKVVVNNQGRAMYFSRAPIPWDQRGFDDQQQAGINLTSFVRHVGIYAYRVGYLKEYVSMPPCAYEQLESLEQLRVLWSGASVGIKVLSHDGFIDVNTSDDLDKVRHLMRQQSGG